MCRALGLKHAEEPRPRQVELTKPELFRIGLGGIAGKKYDMSARKREMSENLSKLRFSPAIYGSASEQQKQLDLKIQLGSRVGLSLFIYVCFIYLQILASRHTRHSRVDTPEKERKNKTLSNVKETYKAFKTHRKNW